MARINMMKSRSWTAWLLSALMLGGIASAAHAQDGKSSREREALRRVQQALRAAKEEASTLERDKSQLVQEKEHLAKAKDQAAFEARQTASRLNAAMAQSRQAQGRIEALEVELNALKQELASEKEARAQLAEQLAQSKQLVATTGAMLARSTQAQRILEARNQQLYDTGIAVVEMYRSRNPAETLSRQEPFFNLGVVTLENISDKWLDRLEAARYLEQDKLTP